MHVLLTPQLSGAGPSFSSLWELSPSITQQQKWSLQCQLPPSHSVTNMEPKGSQDGSAGKMLGAKLEAWV